MSIKAMLIKKKKKMQKKMKLIQLLKNNQKTYKSYMITLRQ